MKIDITDYLIEDTREGGEPFIRCSDNAPEWFRDVVRDAHDDEMPNDWRYSIISGLLSDIIEQFEQSHLDDFGKFLLYFSESQEMYETCEARADIYNSHLAQWLAEYPTRAAYVDEHRELLSWSDEGFWGMVRAGQRIAIESMMRWLLEAFMEEHQISFAD